MRGSRMLRALAFVLVVAAMLALAPGASADVRTVTTTADTDDDGTCGPPTCTLREAINATMADGTDEPDTIAFDVPACNPGAPATCEISVLTQLPAVQAVTIDACSQSTSSTKPCYGLRPATPVAGQSGLTTLGGVKVYGLAISGFNEGIFNVGQFLDVYNDWFGLRLDATAEANGIGIHALARGDDMRVGALAFAPPNRQPRNLFPNNTHQGIRIEGGDDSVIESSYFGVKPDGTPASPGNGENIEIVARSPSGGLPDLPMRIDIGGTVSQAAASTPQCDDRCNVISGAAGHGLDLDGDAGELPGSDIDIRGNFVGLAPDGAGANGNGDASSEDGNAGIAVGAADDVTVGGPTAGDRNYVGGNDDTGIDAGPSADGLVIEGNFVGLSSSGTAGLPDTDTGITIFNADGEVRANRVAGNGTAPGSGMNLSGGSQVEGNVIGIGAGGERLGMVNGIETFGSSGPDIGGAGAGEGNTIGNATGAAVAADSDRTTVVGNRLGVDASGNAHRNAAGIVISEDQVTIGGDTAAEENVISNSAGNAVEVKSGNDDDNLIARNRGSGNGAEFIDLNADGPGNPSTGANQGAQAPAIASATETQVAGTALPGSLVRLFRSQALPNDIDAFVAQATADASGRWAVNHIAPVQPGTRFAATQTMMQPGPPSLHNTSELSAPAVVPSPPSGGGEGTSPPPSGGATGGQPAPAQPVAGPTGRRARARATCKRRYRRDVRRIGKRRALKKRRACLRRARRLPA